MDVARERRVAAGVDFDHGLTIQFESFPDVRLAFERLERVRDRIELLNVRVEGSRTLATVFVPDGKLLRFEKFITDYLNRKRDKSGKPRDHRPLIDAIQKIRKATVRALWTDAPERFPKGTKVAHWWEVWLLGGSRRAERVDNFRSLAEAQGMRLAKGVLEFPERTVLMLQATVEQLSRSLMVLNTIAELRQAKETAEFFDALDLEEQSEWLDDLLERAEFVPPGEDVPHVCLLDTGVNNGHRLLASSLDREDMHTVQPDWGTADVAGHGTNMAGMALVGNVADVLATSQPLRMQHRLESVKLLHDNRSNSGDADFHAYLTTEAIARPEVSAPERRRVIGMAITTEEYGGLGRPSSWSAAVDRLAAGAEEAGDKPRLIIVSAGNVRDDAAWLEYPFSNERYGIEDPGQAWNALTVGAYTGLIDLPEQVSEDAKAVAPEGGLSPFSRTSVSWDHKGTPLKPDVVFEGGNAMKDSLGAVTTQSLSMLTTSPDPTRRLFEPFNATSAATALASRMAAQIWAEYPDLWPETIRGLLVHSAEWTEAMRRMFLPEKGTPKKSDYALLVRRCGFGVPNLERALWSLSNSLTLIVEESLQPYARHGSADPVYRDMHFHELPWPITELGDLGDQEVEMRVTLSYFIEPNPSSRGWHARYSYESHGLRFDMKRPTESEQEFREQLNMLSREEGRPTPDRPDDPNWVVGPENRARGSIHSDIWRGSAVDLAERGLVGVFPTAGWWKNRKALKRYDSAARYSLLISIHAPEVDVDLRTELASRIVAPTIIAT